MKHILISGEIGAGKSTLIKRLTVALNVPVYGFYTKKADEPDESGLYPIYMHPAQFRENERTYTAANTVGTVGNAMRTACPNVFDTLGVECIRAAKPNGIIVMDELGFLEKDAAIFQSAVLDALSGSTLVIAAIKALRGVEFLERVRAHKNVSLYTVTEQNRDKLYAELKSLLMG